MIDRSPRRREASMAKKKRQHYVPQFYLRAFSTDASDKQVRLYHLPTDTYVKNAAIKTQAYEDGFYGRVEIEDSLSVIEGKAAEVIGRIIKSEELPARLSKEHYALAVFVLFQHMRTAFAADSLDESISKVVKKVASHEPDLEDHLDDVSVGFENASRVSLQRAAELHPLMFDLRYKLLCNRTSQPFMTSDHPVVFYNQYLERRNPIASNTGVACLGLQIFLALSPKYQIVFFDSDVYKVGGRKLRNMFVDVNLQDDVQALNTLHVANAYEHVYFDDAMDIWTLRKIIKKACRFRRSEKASVREYEGETDDTGRQHSLLHTKKVDIRMGLKLRCVKIPEHVRERELGNQVVHVRNSEICALHDQFLAEVDAGNYKLSEFSRFLREQRGKTPS